MTLGRVYKFGAKNSAAPVSNRVTCFYSLRLTRFYSLKEPGTIGFGIKGATERTDNQSILETSKGTRSGGSQRRGVVALRSVISAYGSPLMREVLHWSHWHTKNSSRGSAKIAAFPECCLRYMEWLYLQTSGVTLLHPREKIAKMAFFNKPNQLCCIYKPPPGVNMGYKNIAILVC